MDSLTIEDFEIIQLVCTVDFVTHPELIDRRAVLANLYLEGFPSWDLSKPLALSVRSNDYIRTITIGMNQWGYALQATWDVDQFISEAVQYLKPFSELTKINQFERVGLRIFYNFALKEVDVEPPEFPLLANYFNIPGIKDEKLSNLIHYHVSMQREGKRDILSFGQHREGKQYFLRPELISHDYGDISIEDVEETLKAAYKHLIVLFQKYLIL